MRLSKFLYHTFPWENPKNFKNRRNELLLACKKKENTSCPLWNILKETYALEQFVADGIINSAMLQNISDQTWVPSVRKFSPLLRLFRAGITKYKGAVHFNSVICRKKTITIILLYAIIFMFYLLLWRLPTILWHYICAKLTDIYKKNNKSTSTLKKVVILNFNASDLAPHVEHYI